MLNAIVRMLMGGHVTTSLVESLPVPAWTGTRDQRRIAQLAWRLARLRRGFGEALARRSANGAEAAALQAAVAHLFGLDHATFAELLEGFPLVPREERDRAIAAFSDSSGFHHDSSRARA